MIPAAGPRQSGATLCLPGSGHPLPPAAFCGPALSSAPFRAAPRFPSPFPRAVAGSFVRGHRSLSEPSRKALRPTIKTSTSALSSKSGFAGFGLGPELLDAIADAGYSSSRPIQKEAIPAAVAGRDVLGLAQTGTGKTAAFALPILERLLENEPRGSAGPRALVLTPTRELAAQVCAEFRRLGRHADIEATTLFGGVPASRQIKALRRNPEIVVACPGRLLDLFEQRALRLDAVEILVLDEADHMFDLGFLPSVRRILRALPKQRQNLLFSATMPRDIRELADSLLHRPKVVELAHSQPASTIEHALCPMDEGQKMGALQELLSGEDFRSAIVFLRTKRRAKKLAERLGESGHAAVALQGNMSQGQRERALKGFRDQRYDVLVATDIAARGLDIAKVSHVVNFDVPNTPDAYTHRIGRTGRSEEAGRAFTFATREDADSVRAIEKRLGRRIERSRLAGSASSENSETLSRAGRDTSRSRRGGGHSTPSPARRRRRRRRSS